MKISALFLACLATGSLFGADTATKTVVSPASTTATEPRLIIIRHAEATSNVDNVYNTNPENPNYKPAHLTEKGREQAAKTAKELKAQGFNPTNITQVFVSPMPRAMETAEILASQGLFAKDKIVLDKRLTEQQAGDLEGKTQLPNWTDDVAKKNHAETDDDVRARALDFYAFLANNYFVGTTMVITHAKPASQIIEAADHEKVKLAPGEAKVVPLNSSKGK